MNKVASISPKGFYGPERASFKNSPNPGGPQNTVPGSALPGLLETLRTLQNPSLITSVYPLGTGESRHEILKCLVLGKRAGGTPVRVCLFGGLDRARPETVAAAAEVLRLLTQGPSLAQDYAVFGYPCVYPDSLEVNVSRDGGSGGIGARRGADLESRYGLFFSREYHRIVPNGIIMLRSGAEDSVSFRATVNSAIIASEVVKPVLHRLRNLVPVQDDPVDVYSMAEESRRGQSLNGRLPPHPGAQPWPFEIGLEVPAQVSFEIKVQALVLATLDILRAYREFACHGGEL